MFFYLSWLLLLFSFHHFHSCHRATLQKLCIVTEWTLLGLEHFCLFQPTQGKRNRVPLYFAFSFLLSVHVESFFLICSIPATFSAPNFLNSYLLILIQKKNNKKMFSWSVSHAASVPTCLPSKESFYLNFSLSPTAIVQQTPIPSLQTHWRLQPGPQFIFYGTLKPDVRSICIWMQLASSSAVSLLLVAAFTFS